MKTKFILVYRRVDLNLQPRRFSPFSQLTFDNDRRGSTQEVPIQLNRIDENLIAGVTRRFLPPDTLQRIEPVDEERRKRRNVRQ